MASWQSELDFNGGSKDKDRRKWAGRKDGSSGHYEAKEWDSIAPSREGIITRWQSKESWETKAQCLAWNALLCLSPGSLIPFRS